MKAQTIYDLLIAGGLTRAGALGMLGNMQAESGLKEDIAQRGMTVMSDEQYTHAADKGIIDFVHDSVGYGLCQWTYHSRKEGLLEKARSYAASVGDGELQVEFCLDELIKDYPRVYDRLRKSNDIDECSDLICKEFERPAVNNLLTRRSFAHQFEQQIPAEENKPVSKDPIKATFPPDPTVLNFQLYLNYNGYETPINGYKSKEFFDVFDKFVSDMKTC